MIVLIVISFIVLIIVLREVYAATHIQANMYVNSICQTEDNSVLLTFDDGPDPINTPKVLDVLKKHNIKAIFFCIGQKAEKHPDIIRRIIDEGHKIGQHTYYHNPFHSFYSGKKYLAELKEAHNVFMRQGVEIALFRPPLGITNAAIRYAIDKMGYSTMAWSVRSYDTRNEDRQHILERVIQQIKPGSIILLHDRLDKADWLAEQIILHLPKEKQEKV